MARGDVNVARKRSPWRWPRRLALVAAGWFLAVAAYVAAVGARDQAAPADAIIVLGAAAYDARPSPVFRQRIVHGMDLQRRGLAKVLIFTGGYGRGARYSEAEVGRRYAIAHGAADDSILVEARSRSTRDNLTFAAALMKERKLASAIVVSDPLHMARALWLARRAGIRAVGSPTPVSRFTSTRARLKFLAREVVELHGEAWSNVTRTP